MAAPVWIVATEATTAGWAEVVASSGREVEVLPWGLARPVAAGGDLAAAVGRLQPGLLLLTSPEAVAFLRGSPAPQVPTACVGPRTAQAAHAAGLPVILVGHAGGAELAQRVLALKPPVDVLLWLRGREAREEGVESLRAAQRRVEELITYEVGPAPGFQEVVARAPLPQAVLVGSPRAAVALKQALLAAGRSFAPGTVVVASGAATGARLRELGFAGVVAADPPGIGSMLALLP